MACRNALLVGICLLAVVLDARPFQDTCAEVLRRSNSKQPDSYARRSGGYCDGAVFEPNAGTGDLPVIGVVAGVANNDPRLSALFPSNASDTGVLTVQAFAKSTDINYRFDAILSRDQQLTLGPDSGMRLKTPPLNPMDIGWAAWADSVQSGKTYYPIVIGPQILPYVEITIRPTIRVVSISYTLKDTSGTILIPTKLIPNPTKLRGSVSFTVPNGRPAIVVAQIIAVGNAGNTQGVTLRFQRPERP